MRQFTVNTIQPGQLKSSNTYIQLTMLQCHLLGRMSTTMMYHSECSWQKNQIEVELRHIRSCGIQLCVTPYQRLINMVIKVVVMHWRVVIGRRGVVGGLTGENAKSGIAPLITAVPPDGHIHIMQSHVTKGNQEIQGGSGHNDSSRKRSRSRSRSPIGDRKKYTNKSNKN